MIIGVPGEVQVRESRVACTPDGVRELIRRGHRVVVETGAGAGSGFDDREYVDAGAVLAADAAEVWQCDMVVKVKAPVEEEYRYLRPDLVLFTFLHLAAAPELAGQLIASGTTAFAYETLEQNGALPLLAPMSEIAGTMSVMAGGFYLAGHFGGAGRLLGGVSGVLPGDVTILGGGTAGLNAAKIASGMGARVTVLERRAERLSYLETLFSGRVATLFSTEEHIARQLSLSDLVIGAVLVPGGSAPKLLSREMVRGMRPGAVFVDISIDQGGCAETSRPTTHDAPVFVAEGVLHYCVTNMPGAYARTSTEALTGNTLPFIIMLADLGVEAALHSHSEFQRSLNIYKGSVTHAAVAAALGLSPGSDVFSSFQR